MESSKSKIIIKSEAIIAVPYGVLGDNIIGSSVDNIGLILSDNDLISEKKSQILPFITTYDKNLFDKCKADHSGSGITFSIGTAKLSFDPYQKGLVPPRIIKASIYYEHDPTTIHEILDIKAHTEYLKKRPDMPKIRDLEKHEYDINREATALPKLIDSTNHAIKATVKEKQTLQIDAEQFVLAEDLHFSLQHVVLTSLFHHVFIMPLGFRSASNAKDVIIASAITDVFAKCIFDTKAVKVLSCCRQREFLLELSNDTNMFLNGEYITYKSCEIWEYATGELNFHHETYDIDKFHCNYVEAYSPEKTYDDLCAKSYVIAKRKILEVAA